VQEPRLRNSPEIETQGVDLKRGRDSAGPRIQVRRNRTGRKGEEEKEREVTISFVSKMEKNTNRPERRVAAFWGSPKLFKPPASSKDWGGRSTNSTSEQKAVHAVERRAVYGIGKRGLGRTKKVNPSGLDLLVNTVWEGKAFSIKKKRERGG